MRVLLDTNVLAAAFTARGLCADLLREVLAHHTLVTGEVVLRESRRTLARKFGAAPAQVEAALAALSVAEVVPRPRRRPPPVSRDPDDDFVLLAATAGRADLLVTGDRDLLCLKGRAPLPVVTPREAWGRLRPLTPGARRGIPPGAAAAEPGAGHGTGVESAAIGHRDRRTP